MLTKVKKTLMSDICVPAALILLIIIFIFRYDIRNLLGLKDKEDFGSWKSWSDCKDGQKTRNGKWQHYGQSQSKSC